MQQQTGQIRQPVNPGQPRVVQQQTATSTWIPQTDNQQQQQQLQLQRQQQMRIQQLQIQKQQQIVVQRNAPALPQQFQQVLVKIELKYKMLFFCIFFKSS